VLLCTCCMLCSALLSCARECRGSSVALLTSALYRGVMLAVNTHRSSCSKVAILTSIRILDVVRKKTEHKSR